MDDEHPLSRFLHRKIFSTAARDHFAAQYIDDVDPDGFRVDETTETHSSTDDTGTMTVYVVHNGIAVAHFVAADDFSEKWAAFETKARVQERALHGRWADFARGRWTRACPEQPGTYPVVALSAAVADVVPFTVYTDFELRKLARVEGEVVDVTHYRPSAVRTEWQGWWWSEPLPLMIAPTV